MDDTAAIVTFVTGCITTFLAAIGFIRKIIKDRDNAYEAKIAALRADAEVRIVERRAATAELHRRVDELQASLSAFKEHVPQLYATHMYLKAVEDRLANGIDASEKRIIEHFARMEERFDRVILKEIHK